jgi:lipopolysaccharide export system permease protein
MRLSDRSVLRELLGPFFAATFLVLMLVTSGKLYNDLQWYRETKAAPEVIFKAVLVLLPQYLVLTLPVSTALAASLATGRLARDNEITVFRALGRPVRRVFLPFLLFGILVSVADFYISDRLVPWAIAQQRLALGSNFQSPLGRPEGGKTIRVEQYTLSYASSVRTSEQARRLTGVVLTRNATIGTNNHQIITAEKADYRAGKWTLYNAVTHRYNKRGIVQSEGATDTQTLNLAVDFSAVYQATLSSDEYRFDELTRRAREAKRQGNFTDALTFEVDRYFRLSLPAMAAVFALVAPPLSLRFARTGSFAGIMLSVVTVFVAWNTLLFMKYIGFGGLVAPPIAAWATNVLFVLLGVWLMRTQE